MGILSGMATLRDAGRRMFTPDRSHNLDDVARFDDEGEVVGKIDADKALSIGAVWQAVSMISGDVAKLPLEVFKRGDGKARTVDTSHPAYPLISPNGRANDETTSFELWRRAMVHALLYPAAFVWIERDAAGRPLGLYNLLPDRTTLYRYKRRLWVVTELNKEPWPIPYEDCLHIRGISIDGAGCSVVKYAREDLRQAIAARNFTSKFFENGAVLGGILQVPPGAKPETRAKVEKQLEQKFKGSANSFKTIVLRDNFKWHQIQPDPEKALLGEFDDRTARTVARFYNLKGDRLGVKESVSYSSLEASKQDYLDTTLSHWLHTIRAEANFRLLNAGEYERRSHFIDWNINALLWADAQTRSEIAAKGIEIGRFSPDETRAWENLDPADDGEGGKFLRPLNMTARDEEAPEVKPPAKRPAKAPSDPPADPPEEGAEDRQATPELLAGHLAGMLEHATERAWRRLLRHVSRRKFAGELAAREAELRGLFAAHRDAVAEMVTRETEALRHAGAAFDDPIAALETRLATLAGEADPAAVARRLLAADDGGDA